MVKKPKGKKDVIAEPSTMRLFRPPIEGPDMSSIPEYSASAEDEIERKALTAEFEHNILELYNRQPRITDEEIWHQEKLKIFREFSKKEHQIFWQRNEDRKILEAMALLRPHAPDWKNEQEVAKFVKLRPLMLLPVIDLESPPYPERTGSEGRPKGERAFLSVMPDAERAFVEIEWFLTELYPKQKKTAIRNRAYELAAAEFGIADTVTLTNYCKRSRSERQRLWPRPKITLP